MFGALGPLRRSKTQRLLLFSESRLLALRQTTSEGCAYAGCTQGAASIAAAIPQLGNIRSR